MLKFNWVLAVVFVVKYQMRRFAFAFILSFPLWYFPLFIIYFGDYLTKLRTSWTNSTVREEMEARIENSFNF